MHHVSIHLGGKGGFHIVGLLKKTLVLEDPKSSNARPQLNGHLIIGERGWANNLTCYLIVRIG